jgi:hypothetical protein
MALGNQGERSLNILGANRRIQGLAQEMTNEVLLERALRDLNRIEDEAGSAGGELSVLACLVDMAADEAREQLAMLKRGSQASRDPSDFGDLDAGTGLRKLGAASSEAGLP